MSDGVATLDIITPFFNEEESAAAFTRLVAELEGEIGRRFGMRVHKILVDDGSTDLGVSHMSRVLAGSWEIVRLSRNFGKEVAVLAGLDRSTADMVLIMDADLQHSKETSLALIAALVEDGDVDVVYARTDRSDSSWRRSQLARLFYRFINGNQRFEIPANAGDFRAMRGAVARALTTLRDKRRFNKGLYAWAGFRSRALPYTPAMRASGSSKWNRLDLLALSLEAFTSFSVIPLRIASFSGLVLAFAGMLYGIKIFCEAMFYGIAVPGYPSLIIAVVVLGGFNLALLGLVGEYVWVALSESKERPIYIVRDRLSSEPRSPGGDNA